MWVLAANGPSASGLQRRRYNPKPLARNAFILGEPLHLSVQLQLCCHGSRFKGGGMTLCAFFAFWSKKKDLASPWMITKE